MLYSISIKYFLSSWPINYYPWSYMISIGLGYLVNHVVSNKFAIDFALLLSYCVILNHSVTGYIIVTDYIFNFSFCQFILMTQGPIWFTQALLYGISSSSLAGILLLFDRFLCMQMSQLITSFWTAFLIPGQYKCWKRIASVIYIPGRRRCVWYQCKN